MTFDHQAFKMVFTTPTPQIAVYLIHIGSKFIYCETKIIFVLLLRKKGIFVIAFPRQLKGEGGSVREFTWATFVRSISIARPLEGGEVEVRMKICIVWCPIIPSRTIIYTLCTLCTFYYIYRHLTGWMLGGLSSRNSM